MYKKYKKIWLKALRSGKYEQGQSFLCNHNKFCCLGVLLDSTKAPGWEVKDGVGHTRVAQVGPGHFLDKIDLKKFKMENDTQHLLSGMNDGGKGFDEIADWIEQNL